MGGGSWTTSCYTAYATSKGYDTTCVNGVTTLDLATDTTAQDLFKARTIAQELNPKGVVRQCCYTAEHPETVPVILALDVTGSMGGAAVEVAKKLKLYGAGQDLLADAFSGNVKGMGPGCAEMEIEERPSEPVIVFMPAAAI